MRSKEKLISKFFIAQKNSKNTNTKKMFYFSLKYYWNFRWFCHSLLVKKLFSKYFIKSLITWKHFCVSKQGKLDMKSYFLPQQDNIILVNRRFVFLQKIWKNKRPIRQYAWIDDLLYRGIIFGWKRLYIVENISALINLKRGILQSKYLLTDWSLNWKIQSLSEIPNIICGVW